MRKTERAQVMRRWMSSSGFHLRVILQIYCVFIGAAPWVNHLFKGPSTLSIPGTLLKMGDVLWSSIPHTCW